MAQSTMSPLLRTTHAPQRRLDQARLAATQTPIDSLAQIEQKGNISFPQNELQKDMRTSPALPILKELREPYSTRGQLFDAKIDGRFVVRRSTTPFCDAARALLAEGVDPATKLVMRHSALNPFGIGAPSVCRCHSLAARHLSTSPN
jgi:hypothetical protein